MKSAIATLQCESVGPEKGECLPAGLYMSAATPVTTCGEPQGNSENAG